MNDELLITVLAMDKLELKTVHIYQIVQNVLVHIVSFFSEVMIFALSLN